MVEPILTVHDFRTELSDEVTGPGDEELLRNYAFNISQGIVQRVSRFSDALVLIDENKSSQPAPSEGDASAAGVNGGGVMGFGRKSKVYNQEKPARKASQDRISLGSAAREVAEQDTQVAALKAQVAELQARSPHPLQRPLWNTIRAPSTLRAFYTPYTRTLFLLRPPAHLHTCTICTICRRRSSGRRSVKS